MNEWFTTSPLVIAHRGASAYAPENTLAAFRMALEQGAHAIELDAKLTKDDVVVILHDGTLDRTTTGSGTIHLQKYQDIRDLDAGSHFSPEFRHEHIPALAEVLEAVGRQMLVNIELTNYIRPWDSLPERAFHIVNKYNLENRILFSSFNPLALIKIKRIDPNLARALLIHPGEPRLIRWLFQILIKGEAFHPHYSLVTPRLITDRKRESTRVNVWTVNQVEKMEQLMNWGVDGLITDYPDIALKIVNKARNKRA